VKEEQRYYPPIVTHLVRSAIVKQTFRVQVMLPLQSHAEVTRYPVVYATDANFAFDVLRGISYGMQMEERDAQRFILVGIGYPGESPAADALLRQRDLTFPGYPEFASGAPSIDGVLLPEEGSKTYFGADDFQQFIETELIPLIDREYPTLSGERTYFGHSAGGGFGLYTLFTAAHLFKNYIVSSPAMSYDNNDFGFQFAREYIRSGKAHGEIRLYMTAGTEEEFEAGLTGWRLTSSFFRMAALLSQGKVPDLTLRAEVLAAETHMTVWPRAFTNGIRFLLPPTPVVP